MLYILLISDIGAYFIRLQVTSIVVYTFSHMLLLLRYVS